MQETSHNTKIDISPTNGDADVASESALRKTARHISKRTTDLIAIAIVSIGVLTVSGRLTEWWQADPTSMASPVVSANLTAGSPVRWGSGESAVSILAGEQPVSMERRVTFGDQNRVDGLLRDRLVRLLESESSHAEPGSSFERAAGETKQIATKFAEQEKRLIRMLQNVTPFETRKDHWNLYRLDHADNPLPGSFLIATRMSPDRVRTESLAAWAIATPSGPDQWTSFLLTPTDAGRNKDQHATPIPADGRLLISLSTDTRDELTVFHRLDASHSDVRRWARDMSSQLLAAGWHETRAWQQSATSAAARFEQRSAKQHQAMEVTISLSDTGKLTGTSNVIAIPEMELVPTAATPR
ncbi:MAG: hypothetical protein ACKVHE_26905 [Planctomycetales bacterium]